MGRQVLTNKMDTRRAKPPRILFFVLLLHDDKIRIRIIVLGYCFKMNLIVRVLFIVTDCELHCPVVHQTFYHTLYHTVLCHVLETHPKSLIHIGFMVDTSGKKIIGNESSPYGSERLFRIGIH